MYILMDIDGVIADPRHRNEFAGGDWKEWNSYSHADEVIDFGRDLFNFYNSHSKVIFLTSRFESNRSKTRLWLYNKLGTVVLDDRLFMRPDDNYDECHKIKIDLLRHTIIPEHGLPRLFIEDNETNAKAVHEEFNVPYLIVNFLGVCL